VKKILQNTFNSQNNLDKKLSPKVFLYILNQHLIVIGDIS
jgi:hypothetical protein